MSAPKEALSEAGRLIWSVDHDTWGTVRKVWMSASLDAQDQQGEYLGTGTDGAPFHSSLHDRFQGAAEASSNPNPLFIPHRFQGQYEDGETGLFYNRFRYYDAVAKQYASVDPIGTAGGINVHSYVFNPTNRSDGLGLCCSSLPNFCDYDVGSGFSGDYDAITGVMLILPGENAIINGLPVPDGITQRGGHIDVADQWTDMTGINWRQDAQLYGFSAQKLEEGILDIGFNSGQINRNSRGTVPREKWKTIMNKIRKEANIRCRVDIKHQNKR